MRFWSFVMDGREREIFEDNFEKNVLVNCSENWRWQGRRDEKMKNCAYNTHSTEIVSLVAHFTAMNERAREREEDDDDDDDEKMKLVSFRFTHWSRNCLNSYRKGKSRDDEDKDKTSRVIPSMMMMIMIRWKRERWWWFLLRIKKEKYISW